MTVNNAAPGAPTWTIGAPRRALCLMRTAPPNYSGRARGDRQERAGRGLGDEGEEVLEVAGLQLAQRGEVRLAEQVGVCDDARDALRFDVGVVAALAEVGVDRGVVEVIDDAVEVVVAARPAVGVAERGVVFGRDG